MLADKLISHWAFNAILQLYHPKIREKVLPFPLTVQIITYHGQFLPCSFSGSLLVAEYIRVHLFLAQLDNLIPYHILLLVELTHHHNRKEALLLYADCRLEILDYLLVGAGGERTAVQALG